MAATAVILSVVAFIVPLGIAALVLAFFSKKAIASSGGALKGEETAKAAIIIASIQLALTVAVALFTWNVASAIISQFHRDQMVQHAFRDYDNTKMLDLDSAHDEEAVAEEVITQLMVIEEQSYRKTGRYACSVPELIGFGAGVEGASIPEMRMLYKKIDRKSYVYEVTRCTRDFNSTTAYYTLLAVPVPSRMPKSSAVYCADEMGTLQRSLGGTSVDCLQHGSRVGR